MKYLLWIALFFVVLWLLRRARLSRHEQRAPSPRAPESMVKCAYCGVNQPVGESVLTDGRYYCCIAHRHAAESLDD